MSGSRTTRKVTIDSGRRISASGDLIEPSMPAKKKSVFDRLGVSNPKSVVKGKPMKNVKSCSDNTEDGYNSEESSIEKRKGLISFTVKKHSLMEDSGNKLNVKKEKKKSTVSQDSGDEYMKMKKKKKHKEDEHPIVVYSKARKVNKEAADDQGGGEYLTKKKKKLMSPGAPAVKKKRRFVEEVETTKVEVEYVKKGIKVAGRRRSLVEYESGSDAEDRERKKKKNKVPKESLEISRKPKKLDSVEEGLRKKKKGKPKSSDEEDSEEERVFKKKNKKQRSPSWSNSEDEEDIPKSKKISKTTVKSKQGKLRKSVSPSPVKERHMKDYSSLESDISSVSDEDRRKVMKKRKPKDDAHEFDEYKSYEDKQHRRHDDKRFEQKQEYDERRRDEFVHNRKRNDNIGREEQYDDQQDERHRGNQYDTYKGQRNVDYDPGDWRQNNQYGDRHHRGDHHRFSERGNRGRIGNRFDNRDERGQEYFKDDRRDDRRHQDFRGNYDKDWNKQGNFDDDKYNNRVNYRGRGRGRGGAGYRGGYNQYDNDNRYQQRDYDYRYRNDQSNERPGDQLVDRFQKHGGYRDKEYRRDDQRGTEKRFEMSPIRDPNFIGGFAKKRGLSESEEDDDTNKKRKLSEKPRKKIPKEDLSASDASDVDSKGSRKQKPKLTKDSSKENRDDETEKPKPSKNTTDENEPVKSPRKTSAKERSTSQNTERKKEEGVPEEKKKEKKVAHKRVSAVKEMDDASSAASSARKTPELKENEKPQIEPDNFEKKSDKTEEKKRDRSVDSTRENKRERNDKSRSQDPREKSSDTRRRSPDNRRGRSPRSPDSRRAKSPDVRDSPYKRGRSPERRDRDYDRIRQSPGRNRENSYGKRNSPFNIHDSPYDRRELSNRRERSPHARDHEREKDQNLPTRADTPSSSSKENPKVLEGEKNEDVYESISDEELDLFDENDEDYKLPLPASVMEVDWSLLSKMNKPTHTKDAENDNIPEYLQNLSPGHVLADIGYSPSLLSKKTLHQVQELCLAARNIETKSLDVSEETKLQTGMAVTVKNVLKQRRAREALFSKSLIGLRDDLSLRRELQKPMDKVGANFNIFCSPPSNPADYDLFSHSVALFEKKPRNDGDPIYVTISSKVGSIVACKS